MAVEPSLSEITSIQGDAAIGAGANGLNLAVVQQDSSLPYLQAASVALAAVDKAKNDEYTKRLENSLSTLQEQDFSGLLDPDFKNLSQTWAGLMKEYSDNFDILRNPNKNPEKWGEIQQRTSALRQNLQAAKDQKKVYDVTQKFLSENPVWNTDQNRNKLKSFLETPQDSRQVFQLDRPYTPDINTAAKAIGDASTVEVADSQLVNGGRYIRTTEGKTIDMDVAAQNARNLIRGNDAFGRSQLEAYQQLYDRLPETEKTKYTDVEDFFVKNTLAGLNRTSVTKNVLQPNQVYLQNDQQAFTAGQNALDRDLDRKRLALQEQAQKGNTIDKKAAGEYKNQLLTSVFTTGQAPIETLQDIYGDNNKVTVKENITNGVDEFGAPIKTGESSVDKPLISVVSSSLDRNGDLIIKRVNNQTGKPVPDIKVTAQQANNDFNNVLGKNNASMVASSSREFLQERTGSGVFNLEKTKPLFGFKGAAANESPYKNRNFKFNGKAVPNDVLLKNYSNEEIADFIQKGLLKESK